MKIDDWIKESVQLLNDNSIATSRLDCLILLEDALDRDKSWILARPDHKLTKDQLAELKEKINRRLSHEPLSYIRGKSEFYRRNFLVNEHTLEPRPETETMIDLFLKTISVKGRTSHKIQVVDVGTGSGCIAITMSLENPKLSVLATDIDKKCIDTAKQNQEILGSSVDFSVGNLITSIKTKIKSPYIIMANLPYVPDEHTINQAAMFEPKHAIFGGPDGLHVYRELFSQLNEYSIKPHYIFTESLPFQHRELAKTAELSGYRQSLAEDFIQLFALA